MLKKTHIGVRFFSRLGALSLVSIGLIAGAVVAPATAATTATTASAVPSSTWSFPSRGAYVALGDSFTAGQGAPPYVDATCLQSKYFSYPKIAAAFSSFRLTANKACSGATVDDVYGQLAGIDPATTLVTITVGAIDAGSNTVLQACASSPAPPSAECLQALNDSAAALPLLVQPLAELYGTIAFALPNARVVVLGYPHLFNPGVIPLGDLVNGATDALNGVISTAAGLAGPTVSYIDVTPQFDGHGIGARVSYISFNQADLAAPANFHPNVLGNTFGYARALRSVMRG